MKWMRIVAIVACFLLVGSGAWPLIASAEVSVGPKDIRPVDLRELLPEEIQDQDPKIGAILEAEIEARPGEDLAIILMMEEQPGLIEGDRFDIDQARSLASATQAPLVGLLEELGAENITQHWIVNAISANVLAERIAEIAAHPDVGMIWLDEPIRPPELIPALPDFGGSMIRVSEYLRGYVMSSKGTLSAATPETGTISGRVTDEDGAGVALALVSARDAVTGASGFAMTDDNGNYTISDLLPGIYRVGVSSHPLAPPPLMADTLWRIEVIAGEVTTADITLENIIPAEVGVVSGRVTDTKGLGVVNALVIAVDPETGVLGLGWTDAAGNYTIPNLPPATYVLEVMPEGVHLTMARIADVDVNEGKTTTLDVTLANIVPAQVGTIAGRVTDEAGVGVAGAEVFVWDEKTGVFGYTETAADGSYAIPDLPPGIYRLQISPMPEFSPKLRLVISIVEDLEVITGEATIEDVTLYRDYGDDFIGAPGMWDKGFDGSGIRIAILDTGICRYHPDLDGGKVIAERDFTVWDRFSEEEITEAETNDYSITLRDARDLEVYLRWEDPANDLELFVTDPDGYEHSGIDIGNYRRILIPGRVADGDWTVNVVGATVTGTESYSLRIGFNSAWDDHEVGHGTHVAGIAAGAYNPEIGITGVAPGAYLINAKVFNVDGDTQTSWLISAVEWSVEEGADVINLSLGGWQGDGAGRDLLDVAVTHAAGAGHIVVISAGNWGPDESTITSPAVAHGAIAVAASNTVDEIVFFSSRGPTGDGRVGIDLAAPGLGIIAPVPLWLHPTGYADWPGTSMSAPHVAGAAALLLQAFPNLIPAEMERALKNSAEDLFFGILEQGAGRLNVAVAYLALREGILVDHEWSVGRVLPGSHTKTFTVENRAAEAKTLPIDRSVMTDTQDFPAGDWIIVPGEITVPAGETATFIATMSIPADTAAGTYVGYITLGDVLIPVSVNLIQPVAPGTRVDITGTVDEDWDFIHYTLDVERGTTELGLTLDWTDEVNDLDIFLFNPEGDLAATSFWDYPEAISISHPTPGQWTVAIMAWWLAIPETYTLRVHSPDVIPPAVEITSTAADPTNISPIPVTATFSEDVTGFELGDVTVGNGTAGNFVVVSDREFTFEITPDADGVVTVAVAGGVARDAAGNYNTAAPQFSITYNLAAPTVAITSTATDPTNISPIPVTATFSEDVTGFELGDVTVGNGTAGNFLAVSDREFTFEITPDADGVVTVAVAAGVARDAAGNYNTAAAKFRIIYDGTAPRVVSISPEAGAAGVPTDIGISATFSEEMDKALAEGAFSIEPAVSGIFRWVENTMIFEPDVDLEYGTGYTVTISPAAKDLAGNPLVVDYTWSFTTLTAPLNWALIGGIISAVVVIVGLLVYFLVIRGKKGRQAGVRGVEPP
ncbi:S8 family serine peptidase [Dehalococcoidia bacterium]|nr:S8 family serine peptidase [Dehalococcoidia bacterium]